MLVAFDGDAKPAASGRTERGGQRREILLPSELLVIAVFSASV